MASDKAKSKVNTRPSARLNRLAGWLAPLVKQPRHGLLCINTTERRYGIHRRLICLRYIVLVHAGPRVCTGLVF